MITGVLKDSFYCLAAIKHVVLVNLKRIVVTKWRAVQQADFFSTFTSIIQRL